jgi:hypothetical protein
MKQWNVQMNICTALFYMKKNSMVDDEKSGGLWNLGNNV